MNRRDLESMLLTLESTPALLVRAADKLSDAQVRQEPAGGGFSFIENVWHLADLEREGYAVRIRRILGEDEPYLADFEGDRVARERDYKRLSLAEGLAAFAVARERNVQKLRSIHNSDWNRRGHQDNFGTISLADVPRMMTEHDREHTSEVADLLAHIVEGKEFRPHPTSAVA
ncbi:MAG TPA: DinB family protein [Thermoanaerobaculia bacterium]|nr:DinB family protein [Thermoanaerobaculia bacterium]